MAVMVAGVQRQLPGAWCGAGVRQPEAAEMVIKQKWEQCGYDGWKFLFSKIVQRFIYMNPTVFPIYFLTEIFPLRQIT